jgi:transcriptional regulator with XRE-family HTH domain
MSLKGFGERLKAAIKDSEFSQKEISEKLRINQDTITNYVKEKFFPKADSLYDICSLLGISADWLLFGIGTTNKIVIHSDNEALSEIELELLGRFRELNTKDKKEVIAFIKMKMELDLKNLAQTSSPSSTSRNGGSGTGEEAATSEIA